MATFEYNSKCSMAYQIPCIILIIAHMNDTAVLVWVHVLKVSTQHNTNAIAQLVRRLEPRFLSGWQINQKKRPEYVHFDLNDLNNSLGGVNSSFVLFFYGFLSLFFYFFTFFKIKLILIFFLLLWFCSIRFVSVSH